MPKTNPLTAALRTSARAQASPRRTMQSLLTEALNELFAKRGLPPIA